MGFNKAIIAQANENVSHDIKDIERLEVMSKTRGFPIQYFLRAFLLPQNMMFLEYQNSF